MRDQMSLIVFVVLSFVVIEVKACPEGWVYWQKSCYFKSSDSANYKTAIGYCEKFDGTLVNIESRNENLYVRDNFVTKPSFQKTYIGVKRDKQRCNKFVTSEGYRLNYRNWNQEEPNNDGLNEDCVEMLATGQWNDIPCNIRHPYVCETRPCNSDPCQNGGVCNAVDAGYKCTCVNFYSGTNCEVRPPCQARKPCQNGGTCRSRSTTDYECTCTTGWIGTNCENRESTTNGDPHYTTFDGKNYDFMGICEYIYAKDCGKNHAFEVLQQNEACGGDNVSCTKSIRVLFGDFEVIMQRSGVVYVDGKRINLPWKQSGAQITRDANGALLQVPKLLFSVQWDGIDEITVIINQRYKGKMCGLMGNANGNPNDDFQLPDKTMANSVAEFANSWKKNPRCVDGIVPPNPCNELTAVQYKAVKEKCKAMKKPPFQQCNVKITPDIQYIPNCEYDLCAMKGNDPSAAWCEALETYDRVCSAENVIIDWEGKAGFEECGNPCAKMPCFNGADCKNTNRKQFVCTCPEGFSGPTCNDLVCKSGYISRGNICYKKMSRQLQWENVKCNSGDKFAYPEDEDEEKFIFKNFVEKDKKSFWLNARVCGPNKLCRADSKEVYYHNFAGKFPKAGSCAEMKPGEGGKWSAVPGPKCIKPLYFICKHEIF